MTHWSLGKVTGKFHTALKEKLQSKGYTVVDEFNCKGFNTNRIYGRFGGLNKGRPNAEDLKHAEEFALKLKQSAISALAKKVINHCAPFLSMVTIW